MLSTFIKNWEYLFAHTKDFVKVEDTCEYTKDQLRYMCHFVKKII